MKKIIIFVAALVIGLAFSEPAAAEEITIVGTGSGMSVLKAVGEAFTRNHPGIYIDVPESIGSGGGIKSVGNDQYKIGRIAREIKDKEKHYGLTYVPFCKMPIVFFVNKSVGITSLTTEQACDVYSGKITNWKDVGGQNAKIRVVRREDGDSSLQVLLKLFPGFADISQTAKSKMTHSDQLNFQFVVGKTGSIGYGTYMDAKNYDVGVLAINGKKPTASDYPYVGTLAFVFKEKNFTGNIKKFVEFATSAGAHDTIKRIGGTPF